MKGCNPIYNPVYVQLSMYIRRKMNCWPRHHHAEEKLPFMTEVVSQARLQKRIEPSCAVKNQIFPMETRMNAWNQCWSNFIRKKWFWSLIIRICSNFFSYVPWALLQQWAWQWQCPSNRQSWRRTLQTVIRLMLPEPGSLGNKDDPTDPTTTGTTCLNQECARPSDTPVAENCIAYLRGRNARFGLLQVKSVVPCSNLFTVSSRWSHPS